MMDYFYTSPEKISGNNLIIDNDEYNHLVHVMRKKSGDIIRVVDGVGNAYDVTLTDLKNRTAHGLISTVYRHHNEPSVNVTLAVGILKSPSRFDFLVEKSTELGVCEIVPLKTERTISKQAKCERWQKLALSAMKQSGRSYLPIVRELISLYDFLETKLHFDCKLIAHNSELSTSIVEHTASKEKSVLVLIGPEGGFSDKEIEKCMKKGFKMVSFGTRRLRTETAAVVAVANIIAQYY